MVDLCFGISTADRDALRAGRLPSRVLTPFAWATGLPAWRWPTAIGLAGIGLGPQISWWQTGEPTFLSGLAPMPALATLAWWLSRQATWKSRLRRLSPPGPVETVTGIGRGQTRWIPDRDGTPTAHPAVQVGEQTWQLPTRFGPRIVEGPMKLFVLRLPSLPEPSVPPMRFLGAIELLPGSGLAWAPTEPGKDAELEA